MIKGGRGRGRAGNQLLTALVAVGLVLALVPPAAAQEVTRPTTSGFPGFARVVGQSCIQRLDGATAGWVELHAVSVTPSANIRIDDATLLGLTGRHLWISATSPGPIVDTPQAYELWDGASAGPRRTARIDPGERFRVAYTVRPTDRGRKLPAGTERVDVRVVDNGGNPLPVVEESCGWDATALRGGVPSVQSDVDWDAAVAAQNAAIAGGLVLPQGWGDEFLRVLHDVCGFDDFLRPPPDVVGHTLLEVDHGSPITVGVLGDSVTSQIRDELVADTRYNWVVASLCGARLDHFLGDPLYPSDSNLEFGLDAVLDADPDVVVVAVGSVDARITGQDNGPNIEAMMDRLAGVSCPVWMNAFVGTSNPEWAVGTGHFNAALAHQAAEDHVVQLDWQTALTTNGLGTNPWVAPGPFDQLHVSVPTGHQARVGMTLGAIETCTTPPPPITCVSGMWDVGGSHAFCDEISWLLQESITTGYADFTFRPTATVTRQSMAAFLARLSGAALPPPPPSPTFSDVPTDHPFAAEIEWLVQQGIAAGFPDGTFGPGRPVSRQAMAAFLYRLAGSPAFSPPGHATFPDVGAKHPFFREIEWLAARDIASGYPDGRFRPTATVTRQAMAAFLQRFAAIP